MYGVARTLPGLRTRKERASAAFARRALVVSLVLVAATVAGASAAGPADHAAQAWNVLPPGQAGGVAFTKNSTDQIALYEGLTRLGDRVTDNDLRRFFKRETLGLAPDDRAVRVERPRAGVTITRDRWGVPHVKGRTAEDVAFGAGWATAADRQLIMELLRGPGRIAALDVPGVDAFCSRCRDGSSARARRPRQCSRGSTTSSCAGARGAPGRSGSSTPTSRGSTRTTAGRAAAHALDPDRRRRRRRADGRRLRLRRRSEVRRSQFLDLLQRKLGPSMGRQVWEDLRHRDDPEAQVAVPADGGVVAPA